MYSLRSMKFFCCSAIGNLQNGLPDQNFSTENRDLLSRHSMEVGGGMGFVPETPYSEGKHRTMDNPWKNGLKLDRLGNSSYYFSTEKVTYYKALQFCKVHKMDLLNIETEIENNLITEALKKLTHIEHVWTSGTDLHEERRYVWMSTGEEFTFTHWEPNQPDNFLNAEHCIEIRKFKNQNYVWNDSYCSYQLNFVCEVSKCLSFCRD